MAKHQRQIIREAAKARLLRKTAAAERVYETRVIPWSRLKLPAIAVYTLEESVDPASKNTAPRELTRNPQLAIEAAVQQGENVDDAMDAIALEIERAIDADSTLGGTASDLILANTELQTDVLGDQPVGLVRLTYSVTYYTQAPEAADVQLDDLKTVDARTDLAGQVNPANQAEDRIVNLDQ